MDIKKAQWEESYQRGENYVLFPREECVKFINRFIRKRTSANADFVDILKSEKQLKALDFGCGVGRNTILLSEFNIESYGIDISETAIKEATLLAEKINNYSANFSVYDGQNIPFEDNFFDFTMSFGVLDSLPFELAKKLLKEIDRVSKKYFYLSLISSDSNALFGMDGEIEDEIIVEEKHQQGTIQCFYNVDKINKLIEGTNFKIKWGELMTHQDILNKENKHGRYNIVLEKTNKEN